MDIVLQGWIYFQRQLKYRLINPRILPQLITIVFSTVMTSRTSAEHLPGSQA